MTGSGPFGREPAGQFNFEPPPIGSVIYLEPTPKRIRVEVGGETIADSRRAYLLHEAGHQPIYYFPREDVRDDVLRPSDRHTRCPKKGEASYFTIQAGGETVEAGAWYYPETPESAPAKLAGLVAFYFNRMGRWLEEGEEITGHPRDPYHRIDVRASDRHVRVSLDGEPLADTTRAMALFETGLPARWYIPREDVTATLEPSPTTTYCPYKGTAGYHSIRRADGELAADLVWYYADPLEDATRVRDHLCFFNEHVDIELDGVPQQRPASPWTHGVRGQAQNAPAVTTRG
ncbi:MAG TPA: DUF427 domain-containing protein [Solirubrobacteraceae bacterium]|nr:DUF427 domain-containing protein [Solirubrobacteraceae bacterium]